MTRLPGTNPMRNGAMAALWVEKLRTGRGADERRASRSVRSIAEYVSQYEKRTQRGETPVMRDDGRTVGPNRQYTAGGIRLAA